MNGEVHEARKVDDGPDRAKIRYMDQARMYG